MRKILDLKNKDVHYLGEGFGSLTNAFSLAILFIGKNQSKYYPHLNSLVKEQFYRPDIFEVSE